MPDALVSLGQFVCVCFMLLLAPTPTDFWLPDLHGGDPGYRQLHLGIRGGGLFPDLPALGRGRRQCLLLRFPLLLVVHYHPQHRRPHIPLRQVFWGAGMKVGGVSLSNSLSFLNPLLSLKKMRH